MGSLASLGVGSGPAPVTPFEAGINFRGSGAFVTDGTDETYCIGSNTYPTSRGGFTFGWNLSASSDDRSNAIDRRLAGVNYVQPTEERTFQFDLPAAGTYAIRLALGDHGFANSAWAEVYDNATLLFTVSDNVPGVATFRDATSTNYSTANWPGSNTASTQVFASTTLKVKVGRTSQSNYYVIAHLQIHRVS
jgi:hypothetical protein